MERGVAAYDRRHHARHVAHYGQDPGVACLSRLAWALWYLGYPEQALQYIRQALDLATLLKHPFSIEYALTWMQWLSHDVQDQVVAATVDELMITQQTQPAMPTMIQPLRSVIRGKNLVAYGHVTEGIELIYAGIEMAAFNRYEFMFKSHFQVILAQALLRVGDSIQAKTAVDVALTHVTSYGDNYYLAELYRLQGEILLADGKPHEIVEQNFYQALDIAREQQAKSLELRAAMSLARLWANQGKQGEARALLADVYGWFTEGFDTADLQEAKALLAQVG